MRDSIVSGNSYTRVCYSNSMPKSLKNHAHHLDKRLRFTLRAYVVISLILIGLLIYNMARGELRLDYGLIGLSVGTFMGVITSRMYHISWNTDVRKVVSRLDLYGIGILVLYVLFEIFREKIVGYFTHDFEVAAVGFAVLAGIMFGRVLGTRGKIMEVLKEQKVFS